MEFMVHFLLILQYFPPIEVQAMTTTQFIPIIPNNYTNNSPASTTRQVKGTGQENFQVALDQIKARMDNAMADSIMGTGSGSGGNQDMDMFSQALNMNVLSTLSRLSATQQSHPASHLPLSASSLRTADDLPGPEQSTTQAVRKLANRIINAQGAAQDPEPLPDNVGGMLSAFFESGERGDAVGYDSNGGTSYGTFQISSRQGTMRHFLDFLAKQAPEWATRLEHAGPANTGSTKGKMPAEWRAIASEDPEKFANLQRRFIAESHYLPALKNVLQSTGLDRDMFSIPLKEVLFSTAVQHGSTGATKIFQRAMETLDQAKPNDIASQLLEQVYAVRKTQFASSSNRVREAVQGRLEQEERMARNLMDSIIA